jgi:EamA domain-containing membrane protein RarD
VSKFGKLDVITVLLQSVMVGREISAAGLVLLLPSADGTSHAILFCEIMPLVSIYLSVTFGFWALAKSKFNDACRLNQRLILLLLLLSFSSDGTITITLDEKERRRRRSIKR